MEEDDIQHGVLSGRGVRFKGPVKPARASKPSRSVGGVSP